MTNCSDRSRGTARKGSEQQLSEEGTPQAGQKQEGKGFWQGGVEDG